jgi:hypothetical protein
MTCIRFFTIWDRLELHADVCQRGGMRLSNMRERAIELACR